MLDGGSGLFFVKVKGSRVPVGTNEERIWAQGQEQVASEVRGHTAWEKLDQEQRDSLVADLEKIHSSANQILKVLMG